MKPATKKALLESIEHWRENENVERIEDAKLGPRYCALCKVFLHTGCAINKEGQTEICPVYDSTCRKYCMDTPYEKADYAYEKNDLDGFLKAAKKEREFLESLLLEEK